MKAIRFLAIVVVSAVVAGVVTLAVEALDIFHYRYAFVAVYSGSALGIAALLGAFHEDAEKRAMHTGSGFKFQGSSYKDAA